MVFSKVWKQFMKCHTKNRELAGLSLVFLVSRLINAFLGPKIIILTCQGVLIGWRNQGEMTEPTLFIIDRYIYNSTLFIIDITDIRWVRKPVNHTNRMDVVCCHLIDLPQSVSQLSYNRTLQFSKTFRLNRNAIFSRSSNVILPLENPLNVLCKQF